MPAPRVRLLDSVHIVGDAEELGDAVVSNGLSLCSIHHRAFDEDLVGVAPDLRVHVSPRPLEDEDGPMLDVLKVENPDELFISERDNQPYVIGYGPKADGKPREVIAYEKTGVDGKRMVGYATGIVVELDDEHFREAVPH